jgi:hypothetical protein
MTKQIYSRNLKKSLESYELDSSVMFDWGSVVSSFRSRYAGFSDDTTAQNGIRPSMSTPNRQGSTSLPGAGVSSINSDLSLTGSPGDQELPTPIDFNDTMASRFTVVNPDTFLEGETGNLN